MIKDLLAELRAALTSVAPLLDGARFLAENDVPPRFVWVRRKIVPWRRDPLRDTFGVTRRAAAHKAEQSH